nr:phage baseplate assembly protein V [Halolamina pelagica]
MFSKIRTAKYLKARDRPRPPRSALPATWPASRLFTSKAAAMVDRDGPRIRYPERRLIGYTAEDREQVMDSVLQHSIRCKRPIYKPIARARPLPAQPSRHDEHPLHGAAELLRLIHNIARLGTIAAVDHGRARVRVRAGELLTPGCRVDRRAGTPHWNRHRGRAGPVDFPGGDPAAAVAITACTGRIPRGCQRGCLAYRHA